MDGLTLSSLLEKEGINLDDNQIEQFVRYYELLVEWNKVMNLTGITQKSAVYEKHFYDSLTPAFFFNFTNQSICDVGSGAGFPLIPLKICFPELKVILVDALKKRCSFLEFVVDELNLKSVSVLHNRAEFLGRNVNFRGSFEVVIARAVAKLSVLSELCLPLVKNKGFFLSMKGAIAVEELEESQRILSLLGGELVEKRKIFLPFEGSQRNLLYIQKIGITPSKFPRREGIPQKNPIA